MSDPVVGPSSPAPSPAVAPEAGTPFTKGAHVRIIRDQLKVADLTSDEGRQFAVYCDEPPAIGGNDEHPQPLHYLAAAVAF
ncbi:MAG: hypothetical protein ACRDYZ_08085 [Acidimicrobiales bacterium]